MEGKKVVIWVDDTPNEVTVWSRETLIEAIGDALMDSPRSVEIGEIVSDDDKTWGGYRRVVIHISPPICQHPECGETLHNGETTECSWHAEEEGEE